MNTYYIGGSPCAGKSTVAEILSKKYNLYYFKVDDFLDGYTKLGALKGCPICKKTIELNAEQTWMREPSLLCKEEFEWYKEVFEYVIEDLKQISCKNGIITEGAAYVPTLIKQIGVVRNRYIYRSLPHRNFKFFILEKGSLCHIYLKDVKIWKRLLVTGWIEISCLQKKYRNNVLKKITFLS